jgi:hypothetical protein
MLVIVRHQFQHLVRGTSSLSPVEKVQKQEGMDTITTGLRAWKLVIGRRLWIPSIRPEVIRIPAEDLY